MTMPADDSGWNTNCTLRAEEPYEKVHPAYQEQNVSMTIFPCMQKENCDKQHSGNC